MNSISTCLIKKEDVTLGIGTLCRFATKDSVLSVEDLNSLKESAIPGLIKHSAPFKSHYAILTTHSIVPSYSEPEDLEGLSYVYSSGGSQSLSDVVTGGVSCCGIDSVLGLGCESSLSKHKEEVCPIGLDFTILFLKDGVIDNLNLPRFCLSPFGDVRFCIASYSEIDQLLEVNTTTDPNIVIDDAEFDAKKQLKKVDSEDSDTLDSGVGILTKKGDGRSFTVKAYTHRKLLEGELRANRPKSLSDQLDIFVSTKNLEYVVPESPEILSGSPILFKDEVGQSTWIGMHTGTNNDRKAQKCEGVFLFSIQMLLQGGAVPILSLLDTCHQFRKLWVNKYAHMLIPFLYSEVCCLGDRLEVLYYLLKSYSGGGQVLDIRDQDPTSVKKASMDLLTTVLSPFSYKKHDIATVINCGGGVLDKPGEKDEFTKGLTKIIHSMKYYLAFPSTDNETVESTLLCFNALLDLNFQDLVMNEMGKEGFDHLKRLIRSDKFKDLYRIQSLYWEIMYKRAKREISDLRTQVRDLEQQRVASMDEINSP